MFRKILIANRGEIAVRVARACRELGIASVMVHSTADADSPSLSYADEVVCIGPAPAARSYLYVPNLIEAAALTGADAVHPGYGFLSEDPYFAEICAEHDITFIGPTAAVMENVGSKATARRLMADAGLPLLPGTIEPVTSVDALLKVADEVGFPLIIKAVAGGGGRGITVVERPEDLEQAYRSTRATALATFRDSSVYVERYLRGARHIEVQVLGDAHGTVIHLGERDCSVQRRHQKLLEEATSPAVNSEQRAQITGWAVAGAEAIGYQGAGTMEFLLDADGQAWFMEINGRIQVEHPVTEMITGIDLVREQILVATGEPVSVQQHDVVLRGHSIECRINAENPDRDFAPTPGRLDEFVPPGGPWTRVDTHLRAGSVVPPHYDSMMAKVIVWAPDRLAAIARMQRALAEFEISGRGVSTTIPFHQRVLSDPAFVAGEHTLDLVSTMTPDRVARTA
ncbi:MAG TPA: acetyl-CoA carboxylase biotin carboxylase subunit [Kineosporiaceae bacterium]|nr:acetyl-CoA carboxylase biotin carboxylase subunit [Kineosporiaceae bacterium]